MAIRIASLGNPWQRYEYPTAQDLNDTFDYFDYFAYALTKVG